MIKHLILGGLCHIHSTPVSGPIHYLHSPLHHWLFHPETLTPNSAVRDIVQGKEFGMPAALSPGPKFNMSQPIPKYSKHKNDVIRRHTTSCESHCLILVGRLVGWSSIFWVPGGLRRTVLKQNRSDRDHQTSMFEQNLQIVATGTVRNTSKPTIVEVCSFFLRPRLLVDWMETYVKFT